MGKGAVKMTKIGLACAGGGTGAEYAYLLLEELKAAAVPVEMVSCTSLAAVPLLLYTYGFTPPEIDREMARLKRGKSSRPCRPQIFRDRVAGCRIAVSGVDAETGVTAIRADGLRSDARNLKIYPLYGHENEALRETLSPWGGLEPAFLEGMRLCDFSARYGCPFFPLKMAGMERLFSVVFAGGGDPAQTAGESLAVLTGKNADVHLTLRLPPRDPAGQLRRIIQEKIPELYQKLLF